MASSTGLSLQILTPAGQLMETQVVQKVGLPTALGDIEILPGHAKFAGLLGTGILRATKADGSVEKMVVSGGFVNLSDGLVRVMTDFADFSDSPNLAILRSQKSSFEKVLQAGDPNQSGFQSAKDKLARLTALEALQA
jgi:F0F1-type ATP synthase epsilon subunit